MTEALFETHISEVSLDALRQLIGADVRSIYCPALRALEMMWFEAQCFSFRLHHKDNGFIVVESEWSDTPVHAANYFELRAQYALAPRGLEDRYIQETGALSYPFCSIDFPYPISPISRIQILEVEETFGDAESKETVKYDNAIIFHRASGIRFCVIPQYSISGFLELSCDDEEIDGLLEHCSLRVELLSQSAA